MVSETILIVEDDPTMLRGLKDNFEFEGYHVLAAADGRAGLQAALDCRPDLLLLDIMLPRINGYEVCQLIRREGLDMPIIMLTAKAQEPDIVLGLDTGADDYVTKPFSIKQLLARVNALLRRRREAMARGCRFGDCELRPDSHKLLRGGREVELTPKEYSLLVMLANRPGRAFTRDEILRRVWGHDVIVTTRSVDRCVNTLRGKIETDPANPAFIRTVRDLGYRFELPEPPSSR